MVYGDAQNDIVSNCAYKWFCNINDLSTAEYLSKTLGKKTVRTKNKGENKGTSVGDKSHSRSEGESISYSETGRDLMTTDEILNMGKERAILLATDAHPYYLIPVDYWKLPDAFEGLRDEISDPVLAAAISTSTPTLTPTNRRGRQQPRRPFHRRRQDSPPGRITTRQPIRRQDRPQHHRQSHRQPQDDRLTFRPMRPRDRKTHRNSPRKSRTTTRIPTPRKTRLMRGTEISL